MKKCLSILLLCIIIACTPSAAQDFSNRGTEFWTGYGHNFSMEPGFSTSNSQEMVLYFSAEDEDADVTVTINNTSWIRTYHVPAHTVLASDFLPKGVNASDPDCRLYSKPVRNGGTNSEGLFAQHAIHIESKVPIVAYANCSDGGSSYGAMLMPVNTWGYNYISINTNPSASPTNDMMFSWAFVVASHDNTLVEITPSVKTRNGRDANVMFPVLLNKGEIYVVLANGNSETGASGTKFKSVANGAGECYPIAAFAGNSLTLNKMGCGNGFADADMQQLFPYQAWGRRYLTAPTSTYPLIGKPMTNGYKILVNDVNTKVWKNGQLQTGLSNNYYFYESNTADLIEADKPIMVAQFMGGGVGCAGSSFGDPEMIYISPVDQGIKHIGFFRNNRHAIAANYLTLIVPNGGTGLSSLRIDGQLLSASPSTNMYSYTHPRMRDYTVMIRRWADFAPNPAPPPGQCLVSSDSAFTAITYGLGLDETYGYNAGTYIKNLGARSLIHNVLNTATNKNDFTCARTPVSISALIAYQPEKIVWKLSELAGYITPATDVIQVNPVPSENVSINGSVYYRYMLPGAYSFGKDSIFQLTLGLTHPSIEKCNHTEDIKIEIEVRPEPTAQVSVLHAPDCSLDKLEITSAVAAPDGYTYNNWTWYFPDASTQTGMKVQQLLAEGKDLPVRLVAVTTEGCVADTTRLITVYSPPVAQITVVGADACEKGNYTYTGTADYKGSGSITEWAWDFGNGITRSVATAVPQVVSYDKAGEYEVKLVAKAGAVCIGKPTVKLVKVYAIPTIEIDYSKGCLPDNGVVQFNNKTTTSDGQAITGHTWNFGDGSALPPNNNTSIDASPSHVYTHGSYDVQYKVTSEKGCVKDTLIKAVFNAKPSFQFDDLAAVCEQSTAVSIAVAKVTNGLAGTGVYQGAGTSSAGLFTPSVAGAGTHTISYQFTTTAGCVASVSKPIQVKATPTAAFTFNNNSCEGSEVTFTSASTITNGETIAKWEWRFDGGTVVVNTAATPVKRRYASSGSYPVKHVVTSNNNCVSEVAEQPVNIRPLPDAAFVVPEVICMPGGSAAFINKTFITDNSALTYSWNFGDGSASSTALNPVHVYARTGSYKVELTATSLYGCVDKISNTADLFSNKPVASFTASREVCAGTAPMLTDKSTASGATVAAWNWDFGNGATSALAAPSVTYTRAGSYTIQLTVKNSKGCASDPFPQPIIVHELPVIDAGPSFMVRTGTQVQFNATANAAASSFSWTPVTGLSSATILKPFITVTEDRMYWLTATNAFNCSVKDSLKVELLRALEPPTAFSPNGDGIHDVWEIPYLSDYRDAVVTVFNRYGQQVYRSAGYPRPWDGSFNGKPLPSGTYYYVIHTGTGNEPLTGPVTIIR